MNHTLDTVIDADKYFLIDPITRTITNQTSNKNTLLQYDHNSEVFTFKISRMVEGHDMSESDVVEVHYINKGQNNSNPDIYTVNDIKIVTDGEDEFVTFSWLVSQNATQFTGEVIFQVKFICYREDNPTVPDYIWGTKVFSAINVLPGINNADVVVEIYPDIITQILGDIEDLKSNQSTGGGTTLTEEQLKNIDNIPTIKQTAIGASADAQVALGTAGSAYDRTETLESKKQDKVEITSELTSLLGVDFSQMYNKEIRGIIPLTVLAVIFPIEAYEVDYVASVSFDSGETPTDVTYYINDDPAVPQLLNWVGTDCTLDYHENDEGQLVPVSIFQPSVNTHYDIVFYFNGTQMIGLVNGFVPARGNVVSE